MLKIQMHESEVELLHDFLSATDSYFEFGVGGSTCLAATLVKNRICGVDSDPRWIAEVRAATGNDPKVDLRHIDIGTTGDWGTPVSRAAEAQFPAYSRSILEFSDTDFDFCLVDGRFRVACFLEALAAFSDGAILAMHDYASRPLYHLVEKYARPIAMRRDLTMFVRRKDFDIASLRVDTETFRLNWA